MEIWERIARYYSKKSRTPSVKYSSLPFAERKGGRLLFTAPKLCIAFREHCHKARDVVRRRRA